jgi:hypothetical protein
MDHVQLVITLHSGKVIKKPILEPCEKDDESISEGKEGVKPQHCKEKIDFPPILPFPHAKSIMILKSLKFQTGRNRGRKRHRKCCR